MGVKEAVYKGSWSEEQLPMHKTTARILGGRAEKSFVWSAVAISSLKNLEDRSTLRACIQKEGRNMYSNIMFLVSIYFNPRGSTYSTIMELGP